jgi:hypothetical protein
MFPLVHPHQDLELVLTGEHGAEPKAETAVLDLGVGFVDVRRVETDRLGAASMQKDL